jgi:hypothetical protein
MNKLYRFSPINTEKELRKAIQYTALETTKLCKKITGQEYAISGLTIFSHYPDEFDNLKNILFQMGKLVKENNGPYVKLHKPIKLPNNELTLLRIREPDPYRMQVGCNDFEVKNYLEFKDKYLKNFKNLRLIVRPEYEMIEFFDPDFDILAYVLSS